MSEQCEHVLLIGRWNDAPATLLPALHTACGYPIDVAPDLAAALQRIATHPCHYQIAIINLLEAAAGADRGLPAVASLLAQMRAQAPNFQWIAIAAPAAEARLAALQAGAYQALTLPIHPQELAMVVERAAEHQRLQASANAYSDEQRAVQKLEAVQRVSVAISSLRDLDEILAATCRAAVELFGVDHSGLVLFEDESEGRVVAEYPAIGTRDLRIPLRGVALEQQLVETRAPVVCGHVAREVAASPVRAIFERFDIRSTLIVPVIFQDRILGSFSLDTIGRRHYFTPDEINLGITFAAQVAVALEHAQLLTEATQRAAQLEQVRQTTLAITSQRKRQTLLPTIVQQAVALLRAKSGGLYEYRRERGELEIVADYGRSEALVGRTLRVGEGMAGRLMISGEPFLMTEDYDNSPYHAALYDQPRQFGAVIEVPLIWDDQAIGVLYVDDEQGRHFSPTDIEALKLLADHAAIALINANLIASETNKRRRLEQLARANNAIMDDLGTLALDDRLTLLARLASEILEAESGGIFLVQRPGLMTLEASYGHRPGGFEKGREYRIENTPGGGLTGAIAAGGVLYNAHGPALQTHVARRGVEPHTPSECCSLLAIPLKRHTSAGDELIGLLRVDNKKDRDGHASPLIGFSEEDEWILQLFANAALVAIEDAKLVAALREQSDYLDRLIASLPNGVIAIDSARRVTKFNHQAEAMLQYRQDEVLGTLVDPLYDDPRAPAAIGRKLHEAPDGRLAEYETLVRSKNGDRIPIRLAATWIFDAQGRRMGSVGYFEDLRAVKETQRRLDVLLRASNIVAQADNFGEGLARLAEMLVTLLHSSFCRICLIDETKQALITAAVYPTPDDRARLEWAPGLGARIAIADWPQLDQFLEEAQPRVLRQRSTRERPVLAEWSRRLALRYELQSLVMIPLRTSNGIVGLLDLGDIRPWELAPFAPDMLHLTTAIADQTAVLIDRMRLYNEADRQRLQFAELDSAARQLRAEKDPARLYQTIVGLAVKLAGGSAGGLFLNHSHIEEVELVVAHEFPDDQLGRRQQHSEGLIGHVARAGVPDIAYNYSYWRDQDPLLEPYHFQSLIAVPLRHAADTEAVLFIAHAANAYQFSTATLEILDRFAIHASFVLRSARLMSREQRAFGHLAILHQMSEYIQTAPDLDTLLHIALTAITAGYGLGFNRAAVFLFGDRRDFLNGRMGIGHITPSEAERAWTEHAHSGLEDFRRYREQIGQRRLMLTPVGERVRQLRLRLGPIAMDVFAQVIELQKWRIVYPDEFTALPASFCATLQPTTPLVAAPLITRGVVIGMLVVDNKFTREPVTHEQIDSLLAFANTTAIAIETHQMLDATILARQKLQSFYEASNRLVWSQAPELVLQEIVEQARQTANARGVSMILFDEREQVRGMLAAGSDTKIDLPQIVRPNGISITVLRTGEPFIIEDAAALRDRVNPTMFDHEIAAGLCLPVAIKGQQLGVMWVHYAAPRSFPAAEIAAIQLYVNQAAIAYDNARQIEALRKARDAAQLVAQVTALEQQHTLEAIVEGTKDVLGCDAVCLYVYEQERNVLQQPAITAGLRYPERATRTDAAGLAGVAFVVDMLHRDRMDIIQNTADDPRFRQRRFTLEEGIASCVVIALRVGTSRVGVMFVNYRQPHQFTPDELTNIELFADQAAVAIRNTQLYAREQKRAEVLQALYSAGRAVTGSLNQEEILKQILQQAVRLSGTQGKRIGFASIRLIERGRARLIDAFIRDPQQGVQALVRESIDLNEPGERIGIIGRAMATGAPQRIGDVRSDLDYIVVAPDTHSELAVPIAIEGTVIGAVNIEHPDEQAFDEDDQRALELLAAQAAVALRNAQLYQHLQRRAATLQALYEAGRAVAGTLDLPELLDRIATQAYQLMNGTGQGRHASLLGLVQGHQLILGAAHPPALAAALHDSPERVIDLRAADGRIGVSGRVALEGTSRRLGDVRAEADYLDYVPETRSELVVPLRVRDKIIGVLDLEHPECDLFDADDQQWLELFAAQAAIAIENARLFEQARGLHQIILAASASLQLEDVLHATAESIARELSYESVGIHLVDEQAGTMTGPTYYAGAWPRKLNTRTDQGITGRVARTGESALVPDVTSDPDYIVGATSTRAELCVPLQIDHKVVGVINIESAQLNAFTTHDLHQLETIAHQVVNRIENARLYTQLKQTQSKLDASTAVAWMGMVSAIWRHGVENDALAVRTKLKLAHQFLSANSQLERVSALLGDAERMIGQILNRPMTPPLSQESEVVSVAVAELLRERLYQLKQKGAEPAIEYVFDAQVDTNLTVRINHVWLRIIFDTLVNNAIRAIQTRKTRRLTVKIQARAGQVQIDVSDTGPGIPAPVRQQLFKEPISKRQGDHGMGMGLLLAQMIAQNYGGEIVLTATGPRGTTMSVRLPIEKGQQVEQ